LEEAAASVDYTVADGKTIKPEAKALHDAARSLGQSGKYDEAIAKLQQAMALQPDWAYPVYDLAFTYLLKGDAENALKYYRKTDALEPKGFFTTKTAVYALEGEEHGKFPKGMYMAYLQIEWTEEKSEKRKIAEAIAKKTPSFAPAWKEIASLQDDPAARLKAVEQGLAQGPDTETKGMLQLNKALVLNSLGKKNEAIALLEEVVGSAGTTSANTALAKLVLKAVAGK